MKMKKSRWIFVICLVFLLFLTGCPGTTTRPGGEVDWYTGTRALEMRVIPNLPPSQLYVTPDTRVTIGVELFNRGTTPLTGTLWLGGYDPNIFNIRPYPSWLDIGPITEKTEFNLDGGYQTKEFEIYRVAMPQGVTSLPQTFTLTALYDYQTNANAMVCIDPTPYAPVRTGTITCVPGSVRLGGGQGAPVSVDNVEVTSTGQQVTFKIHVSNSGDGTVIARGLRSPHELIQNYDNLNKVDYMVSLGPISASPGNCQPTGPLRLSNEQGIIVCTFQTSPVVGGQTSPVQSNLNVRLYYGYVNEMPVYVNFLRAPGG